MSVVRKLARETQTTLVALCLMSGLRIGYASRYFNETKINFKVNYNDF